MPCPFFRTQVAMVFQGRAENRMTKNNAELRPHAEPAFGPLRVHPLNGRYFTYDGQRAVYLTGSHTWGNMQDQLSPDPRVKFDYPGYLEWMVERGFNFMRGWVWEQAAWDNHTTEKLLVDPLPYLRTGPGKALDGAPKFDLTQFNPEYFQRIRSRVVAAGERGIYVSIMLFQGFSVDDRNTDISLNPWLGHPFHRDNNINGIDGDPHQTDGGRAVHTLLLPEITALQERYVRRVVDAVNDLDNVLYEVGNELYADSVAWQYHMIEVVQRYQAGKAKRHPVGMTGGGPDAVPNRALFESPAEWVSPRHETDQPYRDNPPPADGRKVVITDTDHLWGHGGTQGWVWKSFTRGLNPILMDPYEPLYGLENKPWVGSLNRRDHPLWVSLRRNLKLARDVAERVDLASMLPRVDLASTGYCLANEGDDYLVYLPEGVRVEVDLSYGATTVSVQWLDPGTGMIVSGDAVPGGDRRTFVSPFARDAVLHLSTSA
jgi:hypothetical protein